MEPPREAFQPLLCVAEMLQQISRNSWLQRLPDPDHPGTQRILRALADCFLQPGDVETGITHDQVIAMVREMYVLTCNLHRAMGSIQSLERGLLPRLVEVTDALQRVYEEKWVPKLKPAKKREEVILIQDLTESNKHNLKHGTIDAGASKATRGRQRRRSAAESTFNVGRNLQSENKNPNSKTRSRRAHSAIKFDDAIYGPGARGRHEFEVWRQRHVKPTPRNTFKASFSKEPALLPSYPGIYPKNTQPSVEHDSCSDARAGRKRSASPMESVEYPEPSQRMFVTPDFKKGSSSSAARAGRKRSASPMDPAEFHGPSPKVRVTPALKKTTAPPASLDDPFQYTPRRHTTASAVPAYSLSPAADRGNGGRHTREGSVSSSGLQHKKSTSLVTPTKGLPIRPQESPTPQQQSRKTTWVHLNYERRLPGPDQG